MARLACLPCLEPSLVFWYDTPHGGVLWRDPTRGGAAVTCKRGISACVLMAVTAYVGTPHIPKGVVRARGR